MTPVLELQLYGGPDDGDTAQVPGPAALPRLYVTESGTYLRDHALDVVRADGTPVHRYRWQPAGVPPDDQADG